MKNWVEDIFQNICWAQVDLEFFGLGPVDVKHAPEEIINEM